MTFGPVADGATHSTLRAMDIGYYLMAAATVVFVFAWAWYTSHHPTAD